MKRLNKEGPVRFSDRQVLVPTVIATLPMYLSPWIGGSAIHDLLVYASLGTLFSPLAIPSALTPDANDARHIPRYLVLWTLAKLDCAWRTIAATLAGWLLVSIPFFGPYVQWWLLACFPIFEGMAASGLFASIIDGLPLLMFCMMTFHLVYAASVYGIGFAVVFVVASKFVWLDVQWFVSHVFTPQGDILHLLAFSIAVRMAIDLALDLILLAGTHSQPSDFSGQQ
jgi:hypothetical protein